MAHDHEHQHEHKRGHGHDDHVHISEDDWARLADQAEVEGEVLVGFVTGAATELRALRGPAAPPVRRILDLGSGPGVGTCELARIFPEAEVIAVDSSPAMLERAGRRIAAHGLDGRVRTHLQDLSGDLVELAPADVIWASMALHHVGDEVALLQVLRTMLAPDGLLALVEFGDPMRVLPDNLDVGNPGLVERIDQASATWFAAMRAGLPGAALSADLTTMLNRAGFEVVASRLAAERLDPPLSAGARKLAVGYLTRVSGQLAAYLDAADRSAIDILVDREDPRSVVHRPDVRIAASRQIVIARPDAAR